MCHRCGGDHETPGQLELGGTQRWPWRSCLSPPVRVDSGRSSFLCVITLPLSDFEDLFGKLQDSGRRNNACTSSHMPRKTMAPALILVLLPRFDFLVRSLESLTSPTPFVP